MSGGGSLPNGRRAGTTGTRRADATSPAAQRAVAAARERFVAGDDGVTGVRPDILLSWYRCRDIYRVNPDLEAAPEGHGHTEHTLRQTMILTELGRAAGAARDHTDLRQTVISVSDGSGIVVDTWGPRGQRRHAGETHLAHGFQWSEPSCGTNGLGTALERPGVARVQGAEHWCRGFGHWFSYGIAIRDPVTQDAFAALDVSRWGEAPTEAEAWLRGTALDVESQLLEQAVRKGRQLAEAFAAARRDLADVLLAVDEAGRVVVADDAARELLGVVCPDPAIEPFARLRIDLPRLTSLLDEGVHRAEQDPDWSGAVQLGAARVEETLTAELRPVRLGRELAGMLVVRTESPQGEPLGWEGTPRHRPLPRRIAALRGSRIVLLAPEEIRYAEADRHVVWLMTTQGRLRAVARGLDNVERELGAPTFLRVHRRFLVNVSRIRELEVGFKGALTLSTSSREYEAIPVSRRHAPELRRVLGL